MQFIILEFSVINTIRNVLGIQKEMHLKVDIFQKILRNKIKINNKQIYSYKLV